ncbi:MAG: GIY-YIG nuclease family protein [Planctomycetota bacterium]
MNRRAQTIQIFCPHGEPRGLRIAEITTRIVQAAVVPRSKLDQALPRDEFTGVGLYFLFGESDDGEPLVYIGEADNCAKRLKQHHQNKDFWNTAVVISSRTGSLTKAHARRLEYTAIQRAQAAGRFQLDNANAGSEPPIPEWMLADVMEVFDTAETLLNALAFPVFEARPSQKIYTPQHQAELGDFFYLNARNAQATAVYNEDGLTVLKGSRAALDVVPSYGQADRKRRKQLIDDGVFLEDGNGYQVSRDYTFSSPSAAAVLLTGRSSNGWTTWKDQDGKTLDEHFRTDG